VAKLTNFLKFGPKMVKKGPKRGVFGKNQEYLPYELELVCFFGLLLILSWFYVFRTGKYGFWVQVIS